MDVLMQVGGFLLALALFLLSMRREPAIKPDDSAALAASGQELVREVVAFKTQIYDVVDRLMAAQQENDAWRAAFAEVRGELAELQKDITHFGIDTRRLESRMSAIEREFPDVPKAVGW